MIQHLIVIVITPLDTVNIKYSLLIICLNTCKMFPDIAFNTLNNGRAALFKLTNLSVKTMSVEQ